MTEGRIAQYRILSRLGAGGMGEVFLAEDTRLNRRVAIKRVRPDVLDAQAHRRLLVEARAAAQLDHPNICAIYEVGEDEDGPYLVMPFVEGETLASRIDRGPLSIEESAGVATQVADALAAAHARGILHRDIKPANIMINARNQVRVMDFGLAKLTPAAGAPAVDAETVSRLTREGSTLGTAAYMSPEQARGEPVDARADLFSLGVVIHEMVVGRRPFEGASIADTLSAVLTREALPLGQLRPGTPDEFARIVSKLLRKNREERYQSAADLLVDLKAVLRGLQAAVPPVAPAASLPVADMTPRGVSVASDRPPADRRRWLIPAGIAAIVVAAAAGWLIWRRSPGGTSTATDTRIESLAVLPLDSLSRDSSQDFVAAAMTEELTRALAGIKSLRVISRTSTEQYHGGSRNMKEIARALNVDGLIEGSVVRDGDRVRITAQLIHGPTDRHLWANAYDGDLRDMLALERRVAEAIAAEVRAAITPEEQRALRSSRAVDPRAMELYLKAQEHFHAGTIAVPDARRPIIAGAIGEFREALSIQPDWADAYAGMAVAQHWTADFAGSRESALTAIRLDDLAADGHGALAYVSAAYDWDLVTAEREYQRTLVLNPSSAEMGGYAMLLSALGRHDEAKAMFERTISRDPMFRTSSLGIYLLSQSRQQAGDFAEAARLARELIPLNALTGHRRLGLAFLYQGHPDDARKEFDALGTSFNARAMQAVALVRLGRAAEARAMLHELEKIAGGPAQDAYDLAAVYESLGDGARALDALERAYAGKMLWLPFLNVDQFFDGLHGDARYQDLLRRLGFAAKH